MGDCRLSQYKLCLVCVYRQMPSRLPLGSYGLSELFHLFSQSIVFEFPSRYRSVTTGIPFAIGETCVNTRHGRVSITSSQLEEIRITQCGGIYTYVIWNPGVRSRLSLWFHHFQQWHVTFCFSRSSRDYWSRCRFCHWCELDHRLWRCLWPSLVRASLVIHHSSAFSEIIPIVIAASLWGHDSLALATRSTLEVIVCFVVLPPCLLLIIIGLLRFITSSCSVFRLRAGFSDPLLVQHDAVFPQICKLISLHLLFQLVGILRQRLFDSFDDLVGPLRALVDFVWNHPRHSSVLSSFVPRLKHLLALQVTKAIVYISELRTLRFPQMRDFCLGAKLVRVSEAALVPKNDCRY